MGLTMLPNTKFGMTIDLNSPITIKCQCCQGRFMNDSQRQQEQDNFCYPIQDSSGKISVIPDNLHYKQIVQKVDRK